MYTGAICCVVSSISAKSRRAVVVFPGPGGAAEDGVHRGPAPEGRADEEGKFLASRWWRWSGTKVCSKASGSLKRVWSLRRRGECVIEGTGEEDGDKGWPCAARK
jgi:hypothetical protein